YTELAAVTPEAVRLRIRQRQWTSPTAGLAAGHAQANLVILPQTYAYEFLLFCHRNPKPCPLLDVTNPGDPVPDAASDADLRTDLPRYRIYRHGKLDGEATDITSYWRDDLVSFLLGCSFTFEASMRRARIPVRHLEEGCNVPMYRTSLLCRPAGRFAGPLVVSMRPVPHELVARAIQVTSRYPLAHGAPMHIGDPAAIGIADLSRPDYGDPVMVRPGEVPLFWGCGVTPQAIAQQTKPTLMITHVPGHMFITDLRDEDLSIW
ncbi:MAG: putative hydro-lyase, partial [bacterium]